LQLLKRRKKSLLVFSNQIFSTQTALKVKVWFSPYRGRATNSSVGFWFASNANFEVVVVTKLSVYRYLQMAALEQADR
jgi:hypothetical protein